MFRRLPHPRLRLLPALWVLWWGPGFLAFFIITNFLSRKSMNAPSIAEGILWLFTKSRGIDLIRFLYYAVPIAVILGTAHYVILRRRGNRDVSHANKWKWVELLFVASVFMMAGITLCLKMMKTHWRSIVWEHHYKIYDQLANSGHHDEMVRLMEQECERFSRAKEKLDGEIVLHSHNHGYSYLFCNLNASWPSTIRLAPMGVLACLEDVRHAGARGDIGGYGPWMPIAEKVAQSDALILRALGSYMLEDYNGFAETAYALAEADPDAIPLAAKASITDPYPPRAQSKHLEFLQVVLDSSPDSKIEKERCFDILMSLDPKQLDEATKSNLRTLPWIRDLDRHHQEALGLSGE